jgi:hypothetical protein
VTATVAYCIVKWPPAAATAVVVRAKRPPALPNLAVGCVSSRAAEWRRVRRSTCRALPGKARPPRGRPFDATDASRTGASRTNSEVFKIAYCRGARPPADGGDAASGRSYCPRGSTLLDVLVRCCSWIHDPLRPAVIARSFEVRQMPFYSIQACRDPPIDVFLVDLPVIDCSGGQLP